MIPLSKGPAHLICMWRFTCDVTSSFSFFPSKWVDKKASLIHCLTLCYPPSSIYCTPTAPWKERKDTDRISNTAGAWTPETLKKCEHRSEVTLSCLVGLSLFCVPCSIAFAACVFKWIYLPSLHLKMMKSCIMHVGWKTQLPLCAAHKRMGMTRSSKHLFMSDYNSQTWKCVFFFLIYLHCYCLFSFYHWSDSENSARLIVAAAFTVITIGAIVSHWKAVFKWWNSIKKEAL